MSTIDDKKMAKFEKVFLQKSVCIFKSKNVSLKQIKSLVKYFEKSICNMELEPIVFYRIGEITLKADTKYDFNSTKENNIDYIREILTLETNNYFKMILVATLNKLVVSEKLNGGDLDEK